MRVTKFVYNYHLTIRVSGGFGNTLFLTILFRANNASV